MFMVGSRLVIGSWKTIAIFLPLIFVRMSLSGIFKMSCSVLCCSVPVDSVVYVEQELKVMVPLFTIAFLSKIPMIAFVVTDFPEPDSPTMATVSPRLSSKFTPRIALTKPAVVLNEMA
jgi:hypothetical protein